MCDSTSVTRDTTERNWAKSDTIVSIERDTLITVDSSWIVKQRKTLDSLFNLKDSIVVINSGVKTVIYRTDTSNIRIYQEVTDSVLAVAVLQRERILMLTNIRDSLFSEVEIRENKITKFRVTAHSPLMIGLAVIGVVCLLLAAYGVHLKMLE